MHTFKVSLVVMSHSELDSYVIYNIIIAVIV